MASEKKFATCDGLCSTIPIPLSGGVMTRSRSGIGIGVLMSSCLALGLFGADASIPARFEFKFDRAPIWIAASEAISADGSLRAGVLSALDREELAIRARDRRRQKQRPATEGAAPCDVEYAGVMAGDAAASPARTIAELREAAATRSVMSGRVAATAVGLHLGMPYTVVAIDVDEKRVYLLYPVGRLQFEGITVCNKDASYAEVPKEGDAITFLGGTAIDHTGTLYTAAGSWIFYDRDGGIVAPPEFAVDVSAGPAPTAQTIAKLLRGGGPPAPERRQ
jgi:hypothetical protein